MSYSVRLLPRALSDVQHIFDWLNERSPAGARSWWFALDEACHCLADNPLMCAAAPEAPPLSRDVRQLLFRTSKGLPYRLLFVISRNAVEILRVRGPGQPVVTADDLS